ncbi:unnamed protein product [Penicillium nalgiovense]|uniref:Uncharacterized protein n=1 Tax=Penicillium nalgiovense TaxID=60175 RepID=A0A9W4HSD2_PENNA|nr:unnamed protein product [Penicillium nalgiovense]CAG7987592.1 unnamed protein product [Penicillium nalgiovense]CAG8032552.1 unnamed protein product [Penicillium nalgiovense]CAG8039460.1 unnamed protein product [Penicillium nalgiovense]CAG8051572.1 unnamed protein product [Penicillium nalgiovense]
MTSPEMVTTHLHSWKSHVPAHWLRKPLSAPHRQIVFRKEYIASSQTRLILEPQGDSRSSTMRVVW